MDTGETGFNGREEIGNDVDNDVDVEAVGMGGVERVAGASTDPGEVDEEDLATFFGCATVRDNPHLLLNLAVSFAKDSFLVALN